MRPVPTDSPVFPTKAARLLLALTVALGAILVGATSGRADDYRIASWRITDLWHEPGRALRVSTGAISPIRGESDFRQLRRAGAELDADVVALHSVGSPQAVRRVFPATEYHLVFSRQLRDRVLSDARALTEQRLRSTYAAFVIRRNRDIRVRHVEQLPSIAGASATEPAPSAGLAIELQIRDRTVWVLAADLPTGCRIGDDGAEIAGSCRGFGRRIAALKSWIDLRRSRNQTYIVAASTPEPEPGSSANAEGIWQALDGGANPAAAGAGQEVAVVAPPQTLTPGSDPAQAKPAGIVDPLADPSRSLEPVPRDEPSGVSLTDGIRSILEAVEDALIPPQPVDTSPEPTPATAAAGERPSPLVLVHRGDALVTPVEPAVPSVPAAATVPAPAATEQSFDVAKAEAGEKLARFPASGLTAPCASPSARSGSGATEMLLFDRQLTKAPALAGFGAVALATGAKPATGALTSDPNRSSCAVFLSLRL